MPLSDESEALEGCTAAALSHAELTLPSRLDHVHLVQNFIRDLCQLLGATARPFAQLPLADHRSDRVILKAVERVAGQMVLWKRTFERVHRN